MTSILKILANDEQIAAISLEKLPLNWTREIWTAGQTMIELDDGSGRSYRHVIPSGAGWLNVTAFIQDNLACQIGVVVSPTRNRAPGASLEQGEVGVRIQPFFIVGAIDVPSLTGQGLFARGLHFAGVTTPSNMLLSCRCDSCSQSFLARSFHTGWSAETYFYSASGRYTLVTYERVGEARVGRSEPDYPTMLDLENALPQAPDGSLFSYSNPFRCPHCAAAYIDFEAHPDLHDEEYYGLRFIDTATLRFQ